MVSSTLPIQDYQYLHGVSCLAIYNEDMATHGIYKDFGVAVHDALDMQYLSLEVLYNRHFHH